MRGYCGSRLQPKTGPSQSATERYRRSDGESAKKARLERDLRVKYTLFELRPGSYPMPELSPRWRAIPGGDGGEAVQERGGK